MKFEVRHRVLPENQPECFTETTAPDWLTSCNTVKGSTMDMRWFWNEYILTLKVGDYAETDFRRIKRIE